MTNHNRICNFSSADNKKCHTGDRSLLCPHRSCTVIQIDRAEISSHPGSIIIKNMYPRPHNCCAFCQTLIAPNLTSIRCFRIPSLTLPIIYRIDKKKAGFSRRVRIVAPHIPHVLYAFAYSIVKVRQAESLPPSESFHDLISHKSTQGKTVVKLLVCFL